MANVLRDLKINDVVIYAQGSLLSMALPELFLMRLMTSLDYLDMPGFKKTCVLVRLRCFRQASRNLNVFVGVAWLIDTVWMRC